MKKLGVTFLALTLFLSGCTVQTTLNPSIFIERFAESYSEFAVDADSVFYEDNKCVAFIENASGRRFVTEMTVDRPFIFMIADREGKDILFAGKVVNL